MKKCESTELQTLVLKKKKKLALEQLVYLRLRFLETQS